MKKNQFKSITFPKNKSLNTFLTDNKGAITAGDIKVKLLQREMNGEKRKTLRQSDWKLSTKTVWRSCWVRWEGWLGKRFKAKWWGKRTDWISLVCVSTGFAWRHRCQRSITLLNHPNSLHPVPSDWQCGCGTQSRKKREHDSFSPTPTSISASLACHQTSAPPESLCYCHSVRRVSRMHGTQSLSALAPGQTKKWHTRIKIFHIVAPSIEDSVNSIVLLWWTFILLWTNSMLAPTIVLKWSDISKKYYITHMNAGLTGFLKTSAPELSTHMWAEIICLILYFVFSNFH